MASLIQEYVEALLITDNLLEKMNITPGASTPYDMHFVLNRGWRVLFVSAMFARVIGAEPEDLVGRHWRDIGIPLYVIEPLETAAKPVFVTGEVVRATVIFDFLPDSHNRHYAVTFSPLHDTDGSCRALHFVAKEITELTKAKTEYDSLTDFFRQAIEENPCAILITDKKRIQYVNRAWGRLNIVPDPAWILGKPLSSLPKKTGIKYKDLAIVRALRGKDVEGEFQRVHDRDLLVSSFPLRDEAGRIFAAVAMLQDATEVAAMHEKMKMLDRLNLIGEMAASIGHEVRNPLTSVRGYLQLYRQKNEFAHHRQQFDLMIEELDRANSIITEFLSLAKNKSVSLKPTWVNSAIRKILPLVRAKALAEGKNIITHFKDVPKVLVDEDEIRQCTLNIINNALEATPAGGVVILSTDWGDGNAVRLIITDNGPGIPAEIVDRLGTPFLTTKDKGTGLGLPVCYRIAERNNARIEFQTSSSGTTFTIVLPVSEP